MKTLDEITVFIMYKKVVLEVQFCKFPFISWAALFSDTCRLLGYILQRRTAEMSFPITHLLTS